MTLTTVGFHLQPQARQDKGHKDQKNKRTTQNIYEVQICFAFQNKTKTTKCQIQTFAGQAVCGACALCGIFILTLPIPIVVTRLSKVNYMMQVLDLKKPSTVATGWISNLKVLELQFYNYIIASIYLIIASFAVTYKSKLWRNEIAAKKRVMRGKNTTKADIHFHLATSR